MTTKSAVTDLADLDRDGDYAALIPGVRELLAKDPAALADPWVKSWCGRRWRNVFLSEAVADRRALRAARRVPVLADAETALQGSALLTGDTALKVAERIAALPGGDVALKTAEQFVTLPGRDKHPPRRRIAERYLTGQARDEWQIDMPPASMGPLEGTTIVFCPGFINGMLPVQAFQSEFPSIEQRFGWRILRADTHPVATCRTNADDILAALTTGDGLAADCTPIPPERAVVPRDVVLIGYSKGTPDALALLTAYPEVARRVRALVCWAGAVGGSYVADDIHRLVKALPADSGLARGPLTALVRLLAPVLEIREFVRRLDEFDIHGAVRDLTTGAREEFLAEHLKAIEELGVPIFQLTGSTNVLEVPYFQAQGVLQLNRYDTDNDMQLTQAQAKVAVPMATDLAMVRAHHWDVAYDPFPMRRRMGSLNLDHPFPREAAIVATIALLAELGLIG